MNGVVRQRLRRSALLGRAALLMAMVPLLLRLPLPLAMRIIEPRPHPRRAADVAEGRDEELRRAVDAMVFRGRRWIRHRCLVRGLTLWRMLRAAGHDVQVVFGVALVEGEFVGHCWLERDGAALYEREPPNRLFTETYRYPS